MFVIPVGMMMGANVSVYEWWIWNQIPVTVGNLVGGMFFTGLAIYMSYRPSKQAVESHGAVRLASQPERLEAEERLGQPV